MDCELKIGRMQISAHAQIPILTLISVHLLQNTQLVSKQKPSVVKMLAAMQNEAGHSILVPDIMLKQHTA